MQWVLRSNWSWEKVFIDPMLQMRVLRRLLQEMFHESTQVSYRELHEADFSS
jgi:hypothetical protein